MAIVRVYQHTRARIYSIVKKDSYLHYFINMLEKIYAYLFKLLQTFTNNLHCVIQNNQSVFYNMFFVTYRRTNASYTIS